MRRLYARAEQQPATEFVARLAGKLDISGVHGGAAERITPTRTSTPLVPDRRRDRRVITPMHIVWVAVIALAFVGAAVWNIAHRDTNDPTRIIAAGSATSDAGIVEFGVQWRLDGTAGETPELGGIVLANNALYRLITTSEFSGVEAINTSNGHTLWQTPLTWTAAIAADDHGIYVGVQNGDGSHDLVGLDPANGAIRWKVGLTAAARFVLASPGSVQQLSDESFDQESVIFVQDDLDRIVAVDPVIGTGLWNASLGTGRAGDTDNRHQMVASRNFLLAQSGDGTVHALYRRNGMEFWSDAAYEADDPAFVASEGIVLLVANTNDYINDPIKSRIIAIDLYNNKLLWSFDSEDALSSPLVTMFNSERYLVVTLRDTVIVPTGPDTLGFATGVATPVTGKADAVLLFAVSRGDIASGVSFVDAEISATQTRLASGGPLVITTADGRVALFMPRPDGEYIQQPTYVMTGSGFSMQFRPDIGQVGPILSDRSGVFMQFVDGSIISLDDSGILSISG
jgi:outer membrane protein assembly factor BamB